MAEEREPQTTAGANEPSAEPTAPASGAGGGAGAAGEAEEGFRGAEHWAQLAEEQRGQTDDDNSDAESGFGSGAPDSTASLSSSILAYRTINGRRYHADRADAEYWGSNDERQGEALDINHHAMLLALGNKLFCAPLSDDIQKVLDVGTGTGLWAMDFADQYPSAEVIGTDISPTQPSWIPPNLRFDIENLNEEWTFEPNSFDYVHLRYLFGSVKDWDELFRQAYKVLKPGGWVESYEPCCEMISDDGTVPPTSAMSEWNKFFDEGGKKMGNSCTPVEDRLQNKGIEAAGFVDIQSKELKIPVGGWPKDPKQREIGRYLQATLEQDLDGYILYIASQLLNWTKEEVSVYCAQLRREMRSGKQHGYFRQRCIWGRKP